MKTTKPTVSRAGHATQSSQSVASPVFEADSQRNSRHALNRAWHAGSKTCALLVLVALFQRYVIPRAVAQAPIPEANEAVRQNPDQARLILSSFGIDWCGSEARFAARHPAAMDTASGCPTYGSPDNPAVRNSFI